MLMVCTPRQMVWMEECVCVCVCVGVGARGKGLCVYVCHVFATLAFAHLTLHMWAQGGW